MTHVDRMVHWFRMNNHEATLDYILRSGEPWSYEFRARMTDARKRGYNFVCVKAKRPGDNLYRLIETDVKGQFQVFDMSGMGAH